MMIISCICGGAVELGIIAAIIAVVQFGVGAYNRYKCRKHNCRHRCGGKRL